MSDPYLGDIKLFAGNFAPRGWMTCAGQLLSIASNTALFSILGTTYGGNGTNTFALPDLRSRTAVGGGMGQGPGLTPIILGELGGAESVTLLSNQMPAHNHQLVANTTNSGMTATTAGNYINGKTESGESVASTGPSTAALNPLSVGVAGGNQPHENRMPYLGLTYVIAVQGIFPSRN